MKHEEPQPINENQSKGFLGLSINPKLIEVLNRLHFTTPTPIQHQAIPAAIEGKDIIGIAQTGTGKTLAFGIPMIQRLAGMENKQGLIILPTRELALQVEETLQKIGRSLGLRTALLIGGTSMGLQVKNLRNNPHIVIATPGRLVDHLTRKTANLSTISILVLDEADHMFDMGFAPQIQRIIALVPKDRQTLLFSATMPAAILKMATAHMQLPLRFEVAQQGTTAENVEHELFFVRKEQRMPLLQKILGEYTGNTLLFSRTKHGARKICQQLIDAHISATEIHSNRSLGQRRAALDGFKQGRFKVLVATDIASRGIDIKGLGLVINYDLPETASDYVHRIGRTGRAGESGKAISFAMPDQRSKIRDIERLIRYAIPVSQAPGLSVVPTAHVPQPIRRNYQNRTPLRTFGRRFSKRY